MNIYQNISLYIEQNKVTTHDPYNTLKWMTVVVTLKKNIAPIKRTSWKRSS